MASRKTAAAQKARANAFDPLARYRAMRDFALTPEPAGSTRGAASNKGTRSFVVQKHAARRLHYDFRLELDGTLKSWAVPKGPSLDPADKRMAVQVEDHPLDYGSFEGQIPEKQYGAGRVIVWDCGSWHPLGDVRADWAAGKLKFELRGEKLRGRWTLVRMRGAAARAERQTPWLLIKERDEYARSAADYDVIAAQPNSVISGRAVDGPPTVDAEPVATRDRAGGAAKKTHSQTAASAKPLTDARPAVLPLSLSPQLATLVDEVPADGEWIYEIKFDGYRLLARVDSGEVRLITRNCKDWTAKLKTLAAQVQALGLKQAWLDGEIVVLGENGAPDFQRLQNAFSTTRTEQIQYHLFDLPYVDGLDLTRVPLIERRARLRRLLDERGARSPRLHFSEDFAVSPQTLLHSACALRMEGVIGKRVDAPYVSSRSTAWIKLKCTRRQEFVIGGYTDPQGSRIGLGALLLGVHDAAGDLHYAGLVGTGFNAQSLSELAQRLKAMQTTAPPFVDLPRELRGRKAHWVEPTLVAEVSFAEWTDDGRLRQAVFHGLREDKPPQAITREEPAGIAAKTQILKRSAPSAAALRASSTTRSIDMRPASAAKNIKLTSKLTHAERVIDSMSGVTKGELAAYFAAVARVMLPHVKDRPVALLRAPEGIAGELFFQKHSERLKIAGVVQLDTALDPGHAPLMQLPDAHALLGAAQMNAIELHTWNTTITRIDQPDRMTFDLDPGEGVPWSRVQEAAQLVHALLQELELESFLKTSGGKGLHVVVPLRPGPGWGEVKSLSQRITLQLARTLPDRFVAKSGPKNRIGKIFVDYLRNGRGATTVAAWSPRARPGMGVSVPVAWDELPSLSSGAHWTLRTALERIRISDPWKDYRKLKQTFRAAKKALV